MRLFKTTSNQLGIGIFAIEPGDEIVWLFGLDTPLALRPVGTDYHEIVGPVYVHGLEEEISKTDLSTHAREYSIC